MKKRDSGFRAVGFVLATALSPSEALGGGGHVVGEGTRAGALGLRLGDASMETDGLTRVTCTSGWG